MVFRATELVDHYDKKKGYTQTRVPSVIIIILKFLFTD